MTQENWRNVTPQRRKDFIDWIRQEAKKRQDTLDMRSEGHFAGDPLEKAADSLLDGLFDLWVELRRRGHLAKED